MWGCECCSSARVQVKCLPLSQIRLKEKGSSGVRRGEGTVPPPQQIGSWKKNSLARCTQGVYTHYVDPELPGTPGVFLRLIGNLEENVFC